MRMLTMILWCALVSSEVNAAPPPHRSTAIFFSSRGRAQAEPPQPVWFDARFSLSRDPGTQTMFPQPLQGERERIPSGIVQPPPVFSQQHRPAAVPPGADAARGFASHQGRPMTFGDGQVFSSHGAVSWLSESADSVYVDLPSVVRPGPGGFIGSGSEHSVVFVDPPAPRPGDGTPPPTPRPSSSSTTSPPEQSPTPQTAGPHQPGENIVFPGETNASTLPSRQEAGDPATNEIPQDQTNETDTGGMRPADLDPAAGEVEDRGEQMPPGSTEKGNEDGTEPTQPAGDTENVTPEPEESSDTSPATDKTDTSPGGDSQTADLNPADAELPCDGQPFSYFTNITGRCELLWEEDFCPDPETEWFVLDLQSGAAVCRPRPCPAGQLLLDKACRPVNASGLCPEGMGGLVDQYGRGFCDCLPGTLYWPAEGRCYPAYTQGPCPGPSLYLLPPPARQADRQDDPPSMATCAENVCNRDGYVLWNGTCYPLRDADASPCEHGRLDVRPETLLLECRSLALHAIFDPPPVRCAPGSMLDFQGRCRRELFQAFRSNFRVHWPENRQRCPAGQTPTPTGECVSGEQTLG